MSYPEIISPWGSYTKAMVAAHYGADAVYVWVPYTSLRMRQNKVKDFAVLKTTIDDIHSIGQKSLSDHEYFPQE
jgi:putative protease